MSLEWASQTTVTVENAHEFVAQVPDILYAAEQKLEEAVDRRDMRQLYLDTMKAGIIRREKALDPKMTGQLLEAICTEELHWERLELAEDQSLVRKWEAATSFLKNKLWSSKAIMNKHQENA